MPLLWRVLVTSSTKWLIRWMSCFCSCYPWQWCDCWCNSNNNNNSNRQKLANADQPDPSLFQKIRIPKLFLNPSKPFFYRLQKNLIAQKIVSSRPTPSSLESNLNRSEAASWRRSTKLNSCKKRNSFGFWGGRSGSISSFQPVVPGSFPVAVKALFCHHSKGGLDWIMSTRLKPASKSKALPAAAPGFNAALLQYLSGNCWLQYGSAAGTDRALAYSLVPPI